MLSKIIGYSSFLLIGVAITLGVMQVHPAAASNFGVTNPNTGYFDGTLYDTNNRRFFYMDGIPYGWTPTGTTAAQFIQGAHDYLYNEGPNNIIHQQEHSDARAAAMILMMMGVQTNDPRLGPPSANRYLTGIDLAKSLFDTWASIVVAYDTPGNIYGGSVDFNVVHTALATDQNYSGIGDGNTTNVGDPVLAPRGTAHGDYPDVVWAPLGQQEIKDTIVFTHKDGSKFMIKKWCGNMTGDAVPFPQDWRQNAQIAPQAGMPPVGTITGGADRVMNFNGYATNSGPMPSTGGTLSAWVDINSTPTEIPLTPTDPAPFSSIQPGGSSPLVPFSYTIPAVAGAGTQFCFYTTVTPQTSSGDTSTSTKLCYNIAYTSYPAIQGTNGDIQAGGGICGQLPTTLGGNVTGNSNAPSVGDYVVAGSSTLQNFNSNTGAAPNNLLLSPTGGYARTCRPDLLAVANAGKAGMTEYDATKTSMDLGLYTGTGMPEVYFWNGGGTLELSGTVKSKVTIVVPLGNVRIIGNIALSTTSYMPRDAHSLGIITGGNIDIRSNVTRVDAFLFSNGNINTCVEASSACAGKLTVNGFLMGKNILFYRLGASGTLGTQISEKINLLPQLYLNPPKFFDVNEQSGLQPQGEQPPLY